MEIITDANQTVTMRLGRREFTDLMSILSAFSVELEGDNIDLELLTCGPGGRQSKEIAEEFVRSFFQAAKT